MRWNITATITSQNQTQRIDEIIKNLLINRGVVTPIDRNTFLDPDSPLAITPKQVDINPQSLKKALSLIRHAIDNHTPILVYGDYDADGITATAILWETLHALKANATPFIPSRHEHGYGLSIKGLKDALNQISSPATNHPLIITVDNGVVAHEAVEWAKENGYQIIITDHHQPSETLPAADALIHSTIVSGAGVAWLLSKELSPSMAEKTLDLVCIGTIADMMPLLGVNRQIVTAGLVSLKNTNRPGIQALFTEAHVDVSAPITPGVVNYSIAPRLNAMGRLEHAIDSLRLLCTTNKDRAEQLASLLGDTNRNRQDLTQTLLEHAKTAVGKEATDHIIVIDHEDYHEGIIGLIAGKLVETYYRPSIVISRKEGISKASARSVSGINITELIRAHSHLLLGVGGHPMAAGFSIDTTQINTFKQTIIEYANAHLTKAELEPSLTIDCLIDPADLTVSLFEAIEQLQPFGIGNPQPICAIKNMSIVSTQPIGNQHQHLKVMLTSSAGQFITALWFQAPAWAQALESDQVVDCAGILNQNTWRNKTTIQLILKDVVVSQA
jgi:single-stranded-DNA-specific exonuclease